MREHVPSGESGEHANVIYTIANFSQLQPDVQQQIESLFPEYADNPHFYFANGSFYLRSSDPTAVNYIQSDSIQARLLQVFPGARVDRYVMTIASSAIKDVRGRVHNVLSGVEAHETYQDCQSIKFSIDPTTGTIDGGRVKINHYTACVDPDGTLKIFMNEHETYTSTHCNAAGNFSVRLSVIPNIVWQRIGSQYILRPSASVPGGSLQYLPNSINTATTQIR